MTEGEVPSEPSENEAPPDAAEVVPSESPEDPASPEEEGKRGPGRPRLEFDPKQVEGLGRLGATYEEMAMVFGCSEHTIRERMRDEGEYHDPAFASAYRTGVAGRRLSLRRKQTQKALGGSDKMLIWLGKNELGQKDRSDIEFGARGILIETPPEAATGEDWEREHAPDADDGRGEVGSASQPEDG
jgi:hypothetical protein